MFEPWPRTITATAAAAAATVSPLASSHRPRRDAAGGPADVEAVSDTDAMASRFAVLEVSDEPVVVKPERVAGASTSLARGSAPARAP